MKWFYDLKISIKLVSSFVVVALITGVVGYLGISNLQKVSKADKQLYEQMTVPISQLADISSNYLQVQLTLRDLLLVADTKENLEANVGKAHQLLADIKSIKDTYGKTVLTKEGQDAFQMFNEGIQAYQQQMERYIPLIQAKKRDEAVAFLSADMNAAGQNVDAALLIMRDLLVDLAQKASSANSAMAKSTTVEMLGFVGGNVALAIILGFWLSSIIGKPLRKICTAGDRLALGDISQAIDIHTKDEVGLVADSFARIIESQKSLASTAKQIASGDLSSTVHLRSDADTLSIAMQEMLTSLQGLVSETEKLTKAAVEGNLAIRGEAEKFEGGYRAIIRGFNETLDAVIGPIDEAAEVLKEVAERDLTARVKGNYKGDLAKIKDALNMAVNNLDVALAQVAGSAEQVAAAASQISSGSQTLSQGASQQAGSLEETSSSLQEMASISKQNATNAKEARQLTEKAELSTNQGMDNMKRLSLAIDKIKNSSDATAKIVKAINEIAFQTNLLALNAAVEAARAGDAGKGFAVVADEVRTLALRSADAARQTENLIEGSVKNAEAGVSINREVIHSLEEINAQVRRVSEVMAGIAAASSQQSQGVEQTTSAVEQMNLVTQQTAANAEESASTSQELSSQAEAMRNIVQGFKLSSSTISVAQAPSEKAVFKAVNARTEVARKPAKTVNIFRRPVVQQKPADEPDMMALSEF